jgi:hypothetical protein
MKKYFLFVIVILSSVLIVPAQNSLDFIVKDDALQVVYTKGEKKSEKKTSFTISEKGEMAGYKIKAADSYLTVYLPAKQTCSVFKAGYFVNSPIGAENSVFFTIEYNATQDIQMKFKFAYYANLQKEKESYASEIITLPKTDSNKRLSFDLSSKIKGDYKGILYFFAEHTTPLQEDGILNIKHIHIGKNQE